jgi:hypothetical protein
MTPKERMVARTVPRLKLREHSKLHWPPGSEPNPPWAGPTPDFPDPSRVVLTKVELVEADKHAARHLTLTGSYDGNLYRTTLTIDDLSLLNNLCKSLGRCLGETIAEIGSHEVDRSLQLS